MNGAGDPFLQNYSSSDLEAASEFLSIWLPFLTRDLCNHCSNLISHRVRSLNPREYDTQESCPSDSKDETDINDTEDTNSLGSWKDGANGIENIETVPSPEYVETWRRPPSMSWADMAQEDMDAEVSCDGSSQVEVVTEAKATNKTQLSREERERRRFENVVRKKDFICLERVNGKIVNILDGLELHCEVFSGAEQKRIVDYVYVLQEMGKNKELKERTFTAPHKWMKGKGRVTIQFGCCYNYATDKNGNPPGILRNELVDPIPHLFKVMIRRLVAWHVLPPSCVPDSCIVNIYDEGDCIPPHIDNHDFVRPFCTVSFLSQCDILFGTNLKIEGPGEFSGTYRIPLPVGSVLVLNGNGADVAKHCVPAVPTKRISITFRKMDESKWPAKFEPEPDLQGLNPLPTDSIQPKPAHPPYRLPVTRHEPRANFDKPVHPQFRQPARRDDTRDNSRSLLGPHPRFDSQSQSQSQSRQQRPSYGYPRRTRLE